MLQSLEQLVLEPSRLARRASRMVMVLSLLSLLLAIQPWGVALVVWLRWLLVD